MKKTLFAAVMACAASAQAVVAETAGIMQQPDSVYLLSYSDRPDGGLKIAYSVDGRGWIDVGDGYAFVKSDFGAWGAQKRMFSPSMVRGENGMWYCVWAVNDRNAQFAVTSTPDLFNWKPQDYPEAKSGENVVDPVLELSGGKFSVTYKTRSGKVYRQTSSDFKNWSKPAEVSEAVYKSRRTKARLNGNDVSGEVRKVEWSVVDNLLARSTASAYKGMKNGERMADDGRRFAGLKEVKAELDINAGSQKSISDMLMGIFFEDINYSADGGLYAELVRNRDFEFSEKDGRAADWNAKTAWSLKGDGCSWDIAVDNPIHENNAHYSVLSVEKTGAMLVNDGYDGIAVKKGEKYDVSAFLRSLDGKSGKMAVKLIADGKVIASANLSYGKNWKKVKAVLKPEVDAKTAQLAVEPMKTGKIGVDFVSLFPQETFKNRANGMRRDLAQTLYDLKPRFVRFPGGCVAHGNGVDNIYRWKNTVGPLEARKQDFNLWGYHQSFGLGYYEYFQFCEDIGAEPLPVVAAGVPCQNSSRGGDGQMGGIPMEDMDEYLQDILDLVEWANGDPKTSKWAKMRAEAGHPEPFNLKYIGIGNEDLISDCFTERYKYLCDGVRKKYPYITVIGTVGPFYEGSDYDWGWKIAKEMKLPIVDEHYYNNPGWFIHNQNFYDKYERNSTKVYLGEYASRGNRVENALVEALHLINVERNADVVHMTSYAPLLAKEGHTQWNPDLIYFNNTEVHPTVNYTVQKLFGNNSGTLYLDNELKVDDRREDVKLRVASSVVKDEKTGDMIIKLVNLLPAGVNLKINAGQLGGYEKNAQVTLMHGNFDSRNAETVNNEIEVEESFNYSMPEYSFAVIRIKADAKKKK